ncbi:tyrosine--tRNA ligase [bacterium]|nr:tyrosine--tRNA ligase [bacterium]
MTELENDIENLLVRGVVDVIVKEDLTAKIKSGKKLKVKLGIDPTGGRIHLGRTIPLRKLRQFQQMGHHIIIIIGDFTGMIGDPSDKEATRKMLTREEIEKNMKDYKRQIGKILDLDKTEFTYNSTWLSGLSFKDVIELASHFTVQQMIVRDLFKKRLDDGKPISIHEFMYPLMQGYDSVAIKADVELGGTDQTFNLLAGRTLQKAFGQEPQNILTTPMLLGTDGRKMSTTWGNVITLEDEPSEIFGKLMSISDDMIMPYMRLCTDIPESEIIRDENAISSGSVNPMLIKKKLARDITRQFHNEELASKAEEEFEKLVQKKEIPDDIAEFIIEKPAAYIPDIINASLNITKSEARRLIEQGGVSINSKKIQNFKDPYKFTDGDIIKVGKRKYILIKIQNR